MKHLFTEDFLHFQNHKIWYGRFDPTTNTSDRRIPILCLHGGPGVPHDYLESLSDLTATGRSVIFYDQLGCGNSEQATDPSIYSIAYFQEELAHVRKVLGLEIIHLLGQSWGGCLALEHTLVGASGIESLILSNTPSNVRQFVSEAYRLMSELPPDVYQVIKESEAEGKTDSPAYQAAMEVFKQRHFCLLNPLPDSVQRAYQKVGRDFRGAGKIMDWDVTPKLATIQIPTLLISGRYDQVTPACVEPLHQKIAGSKWLIFQESSHLPHLEEHEKFIKAVSEFIAAVEDKN
ncbi:proline iminopeptidase-family hydrolase [Nostocaceae cyanobacterium CENA369]|uniref:Proline iminopeptidase n=1 Tax=Dendronalium phyllosphericum CENA369 TaxID=1725256 RepID=A0A8J7ID45_9NOST|nr:proline iminopeptidase-family hydrolase [Dendronalium phyllosphericum]MBH8575102.1 proline iminopeptidase-family hydrolase [Dendronalium phyllosphericum CENA369]